HAHRGNKIAWGSPFGGHKIAWMRKARPANVVACCFSCMQTETYRGGGTHLVGGDAGFRGTPGKVPIAPGIKGALDTDWNQQARPLGELLGVHIATVSTRRQRPQALLGNRPT